MRYLDIRGAGLGGYVGVNLFFSHFYFAFLLLFFYNFDLTSFFQFIETLQRFPHILI